MPAAARNDTVVVGDDGNIMLGVIPNRASIA
jgi:hypothetical protein